MPVTLTSTGTLELYRGRTRVYRGKVPADLLGAIAGLVENIGKASGTYEVRVTGVTASYSAPVVGTINLVGSLP